MTTARKRRARVTGLVRAVVLGALAGACVPPAPAPVPAPVPAPRPVPAPVRPAAVDALVRGVASEVGVDPLLGARLDSILSSSVAEGAAPGAALAVARHGRLIYLGSAGRLHSGQGAPAAEPTTIYDVASLTKVVATTTAAMMLEEQGLLDLDRTVASYLPELSDSSKAGITVRMLLTHTGGLEAGAPLHLRLRGREAYLEAINQRPLAYAPGTRTVYSDWDMILLQLVLERVTGQTLDRFAEERIFVPLGMRDTRFLPPAVVRERVAPTEVVAERGGLLHGEVHDGNAWALGGVAGHAGLFSTAGDLAVFAQMMLNGGSYAGVRLLRPRTIARWTAPQRPGSSRALGWDTPSGRSSAGRFFSPRAFGHTGWTGTSLWIDPQRDLFVVLLTNRVNPTGDNQRHVPLRRAVADAVQEAVTDAPLVQWEDQR